MPKELGRLTLNLKQVRSISSFGVTVGATPGTDFIDVQPVVERRDAVSDELTEVMAAEGHRFSEAEIRGAIGGVAELPDYDTLRLGLAKLLHGLMDTRE